MPRDSSRSSRSSSRSAGGSSRDHDLAVQFYSRETSGHWGALVNERGTENGTLFHVRSDTRRDPDRFYFEERPDQHVLSQSTYGRSIRPELPDVHHRYAGRLEEERLVGPGHRDYFKQRHGRSGVDIGRDLERDGRSWIGRPEEERSGPADARYNDTSRRQPTGRLNLGRFADTFAGRGTSPSDRDDKAETNPLDDPNYFRRGRR
ncbi:hypothetical protein FH972_022240 [Carpinus fangiana]|uniref:Uncharacterized protein n=1 Tax=Carpinus fangiana TaxID=176857 RepID=A0A5N6KS14_9ROSI|nr:hypothetical protein FH972_022240 [Carpinus fangiana]